MKTHGIKKRTLSLILAMAMVLSLVLGMTVSAQAKGKSTPEAVPEGACTVCRGTGNSTCGICHGDTIVDCDNCDNNGYMDCGDCVDGTVDCINCDTQGYVVCTVPGCHMGEIYRDCDNCNATGYVSVGGSTVECPVEDCWDGKIFVRMCGCNYGCVACDVCGTNGYLPCETCGESGQIECPVCHQAAGSTCTECENGLVACSHCSGTGVEPKAKKKQATHFFPVTAEAPAAGNIATYILKYAKPENLRRVKVDRQFVDNLNNENYTIAYDPGTGLTVQFTEAFLNTLPEGKHLVEIDFTNGYTLFTLAK